MQVVERFRHIFGKEHNLKKQEQRSLKLQGEMETILNKANFGMKDFNSFVRGMTRLISQNKDHHVQVFTGGKIMFFGNTYDGSPAIEINNGEEDFPQLIVSKETVFYKPERINPDNPAETFKPYLKLTTPRLPAEIEHDSYVTGATESMKASQRPFASDVFYKSLTERQVQDFCRKVYGACYNAYTPHATKLTNAYTPALK